MTRYIIVNALLICLKGQEKFFVTFFRDRLENENIDNASVELAASWLDVNEGELGVLVACKDNLFRTLENEQLRRFLCMSNEILILTGPRFIRTAAEFAEYMSKELGVIAKAHIQ